MRMFAGVTGIHSDVICTIGRILFKRSKRLMSGLFLWVFWKHEGVHRGRWTDGSFHRGGVYAFGHRMRSVREVRSLGWAPPSKLEDDARSAFAVVVKVPKHAACSGRHRVSSRPLVRHVKGFAGPHSVQSTRFAEALVDALRQVPILVSHDVQNSD